MQSVFPSLCITVGITALPNRNVRRRYLAVAGPGHPMTLVASHNLGRCLLEGGRLDEAEAMYREIVPIAERELPETHPFRKRLLDGQEKVRAARAALGG